jgi:hypothetical protein
MALILGRFDVFGYRWNCATEIQIIPIRGFPEALVERPK